MERCGGDCAPTIMQLLAHFTTHSTAATPPRHNVSTRSVTPVIERFACITMHRRDPHFLLTARLSNMYTWQRVSVFELRAKSQPRVPFPSVCISRCEWECARKSSITLWAEVHSRVSPYTLNEICALVLIWAKKMLFVERSRWGQSIIHRTLSKQSNKDWQWIKNIDERHQFFFSHRNGFADSAKIHKELFK